MTVDEALEWADKNTADDSTVKRLRSRAVAKTLVKSKSGNNMFKMRTKTVTTGHDEDSVLSEIDAIDFHVGDHLIQAIGDQLTFFIMGDTSKEGITFMNDNLLRILKAAAEQAESC